MTTRTCPTLNITPETTIRQLSDALMNMHDLTNENPALLARFFRDVADAISADDRAAT
jgi:hypothetical protein